MRVINASEFNVKLVIKSLVKGDNSTRLFLKYVTVADMSVWPITSSCRLVVVDHLSEVKFWRNCWMHGDTI